MSVTGDSSYSSRSDGCASNYNYLSFFATGSYGRRLEGQRSRDPNLARLENEKKIWKRITGGTLAFMFLANIVVAISLITWERETRREEEVVGFHGNLYDAVYQDMKLRMKNECRPRYRKTRECSKVAAQMILVASPLEDQVVWSDEQQFPNYNRSTLGAFRCPGIEIDKQVGRFIIQYDSFYQIHSHLLIRSIRSMKPNSTFQHLIVRLKTNAKIDLAEETITPPNACTNNKAGQMLTKGAAAVQGACFSSSILATDYLTKGDLIYIELKVDGDEVKPNEVGPIDLVYDGLSSYFGIVKLGRRNIK